MKRDKCGGWGFIGPYLLILVPIIFGFIGHSEHFGKDLADVKGAFWIRDGDFFFGTILPCHANFPFGLP